MGREKNNIKKTIDELSVNKKAPIYGYIILLLIYLITNSLVRRVAGASGALMVNGNAVPYPAFAGVFTAVANIAVIMIVVYYKRLGFVTAMILLFSQFPFIVISLFVRHNYTSLPGFFTNVSIIVAVILLRVNDKRADVIKRKMAQQAVTDNLTGLPNRFACRELVNDLIKKRKKFAIVSIDINNFKNINDTMGFDAGNMVLIEAGKRWMEIADGGEGKTLDFISRFTGDEFCLIIRKYDTEEDVINTIKKYEEAIEQAIDVYDCDMFVNASFGYDIFPDDTENIDNLFSFSNTAMKEIKSRNSSNHILRFTPDLLKAEKTMEIERKLRNAIENDTIFFNLQPQYDMSHKLRGFEALARMKDEEGNVISPGEFIPVAEKVGLIDTVDGIVSRKAAIFFGEMLEKTGLDITLSVNASVRHLMKNEFIDEVRDILEVSKVPVHNLEIEITESIMIESVDKALQVIDEIEKMGIQIAIDDFGTGYSSLSYLNRFPADLLKVDKSFIDNMNESESSKQYVEAIISMGHIMGFDVISEGVEKPEQLDTLKQIGCDYIQGYIWGKPLSAEDAAKVMMDAAG